MSAEFADRICRSLPGAVAERPFGPDMLVWTVGGRMFAAYTEGGKGISVTCGDGPTAQRLVQQKRAESAPYLKRGGWVLFPWMTTPQDELRDWIEASYSRVRAGLSAEAEVSLPVRANQTMH
ncbi:hypothetical protein HKCCE3408_18265 [Rhodobacterales bacterium HKCCE3408]|nr:hypothetical protein [Rhodobacterales bacterium HKCCE3408]